jgi:hypothetical protein
MICCLLEILSSNPLQFSFREKLKFSGQCVCKSWFSDVWYRAVYLVVIDICEDYMHYFHIYGTVWSLYVFQRHCRQLTRMWEVNTNDCVTEYFLFLHSGLTSQIVIPIIILSLPYLLVILLPIFFYRNLSIQQQGNLIITLCHGSGVFDRFLTAEEAVWSTRKFGWQNYTAD